MSEGTTRPLQLLAEVQLNADQLQRLRTIAEYDLWFVSERIAKKGFIADHRIDEAITEFRKYMALIALGYPDLGMHSREVDEVWHSFILFTREYSEFCESACGHMVHHRPNTSRRPRLPEASVPLFKDAYQKFFGPLPAIWFTETEVLLGDCDVTQAPPHAAECDTADDGGYCQAECEASGPTNVPVTQFASQLT